MKRILTLVSALLLICSCGTEKIDDPGKKEKPQEEQKDGDTITAPPANLLQWLDGKSSPLSSWYTKYISDEGLPILASSVVRDEAILQCRDIVHAMLTKRPEARKEMIACHFRIAICGYKQNITDIPECAMMKVWWPDTDWDARGRGYGATLALPVMSIGEENLVKIPNFTERYWSESIMVHEFAHNVDFALRRLSKDYENLLLACFENAQKNGLWKDTYSMSNSEEYFAEASQAWYNTCRMVVPDPKTGKTFTLKTREQLKDYDPMLYNLLTSVYTEDVLHGYHFDYE